MDINKISNIEMVMDVSSKIIPANERTIRTETSQPTTSVSLGHSIAYDKEANVFVLKWTDKDSKKVVEQIPVQVMLEFAKSINKLLGNVVNVNI